MLSFQLVGGIANQVLLVRECGFVVDATGFLQSAAGHFAGQHARVSRRKHYVIRPVLPVSTATELEFLHLITTWPARTKMRSRGGCGLAENGKDHPGRMMIPAEVIEFPKA